MPPASDADPAVTGRLRRLLRPVHADVVCVTLLALLVLALFAPALLGGETFYHRDLLFNHIPRKQATLAVLREGSLPLWNPYLNEGEPLLGNPNNVVLHPSTLLFLVLPFFAAFSWAMVGNFLLAALSMYLLLRRWQVRPAAALVAAAGYVLSGHLLSLGSFLNALAAAAPAPLGLLAADLVARDRARLGPLLLGAVWAVQALGGEPVVALASVLLAAGYLLAVAAGVSWRERLANGLGGLLRAAAWAAGLSALQLLPFAELVAASARATDIRPDQVTAWSLHPASLLEVLVPGLFGDPTMPDTPHYWGGALHHRGMPYILSLGVAKATLVLALVGGLVSGRKNRYLVTAGAVFVVLALGRNTPLPGLLLRLAPWLGVARYPVKLFFATNLCLCCLAGLGLEALLSGRRPPRLGWALPGLAVACAAGLAAAWWVPAPPRPEALVVPLALAASCLVLSLVLTWWLGHAGDRAGRAVWVLAALTVVELWPAHHRLNPTAPVELLARPPTVVARLEAEPGLGRIQRRPTPPDLRLAGPPANDPLPYHLFNLASLYPNAGLSWGLAYGLNATSDGLDWPAARLLGSFAQTLEPDRRLRLLGIAGITHLLLFQPIPSPVAEPLAELDVGADRPLFVYRNRAVLPRAFVVGEALRVDDPVRACWALDRADLDPRRTVVLSGVEPGAGGATPASTCRVVAATANRVVLEAVADAPGWVVLLDALAPGWRATVDGRPVPIARADVCFRAVAVPAGTHAVEMVYRPWTVAVGATLSAFTLLAAAWSILGRRARRQAGARSPG